MAAHLDEVDARWHCLRVHAPLSDSALCPLPVILHRTVDRSSLLFHWLLLLDLYLHMVIVAGLA